MADPRVLEHAKIVVNYSCKVKKNDFAVILGNPEAHELIVAIASELGRAGAHYVVLDNDSSINRAYALAADDATLSTLPPQMLSMFKEADVFINLGLTSSNSQEMSDVPPQKLQLMVRTRGPLTEVVDTKRWNITLHPTKALAQDAKMSFEEYCDFVYSATLRDWPKMASEMKVLYDKMAKAKQIHIVGKDTDVSFSIDGRKPIIDAGEKNLPGGEVYVSPVDSTVNGDVYFDLPVNYMGRDIKGVRLSFRDGAVMKSSAEEGSDTLEKMLAVDQGASRVGELGVGMNRGINRFTKNILFDEKMGDTIHMAVGHSFPESGGTNESAVHIDMIKSMKEDGAVYFDGVPIYKDGKFAWE